MKARRTGTGRQHLLRAAGLTMTAATMTACAQPSFQPPVNRDGGALPLRGGSSTPDAGINLALGRPYQLEPSPSYGPCTDPGDVTQLTDGEHAPSRPMWQDKAAVGWRGHMATITLDLGSVEPISRVAYSTAAGLAGVEYPSAVDVLVSDDAKIWRRVGDVMKPQRGFAPTAGQYTLHEFEASGLSARGRFVRLIVSRLESDYIFVDEIEVNRGDDAAMSKQMAGREIDDVAAYTAQLPINVRARVRMENDTEALRGVVTSRLLNSTEYAGLIAGLDALENAIFDVDVTADNTWSTRFPIHPVHGRVFALQAAAWRAMGLHGAIIWPSALWDTLEPTAVPSTASPLIDLAMMRGETRSAALNVSNAGEQAATLDIQFSGLPCADNSSCLSVFEIGFTDTTATVPIMSALVPVAQNNGKYSVVVPPGLTKQVWLNVHTDSANPKDWVASAAIEQAGQAIATVPLRVKVYPVVFPSVQTLHVGGFDYTDLPAYDVTNDNVGTLIRVLREHQVDTTWAQKVTLPTGTFDSTGKMTATPDPAQFRQWIARWPGAASYMVFLDVSPQAFAGLALSTTEFRRALTTWAQWWWQEAKHDGLAPGQLHLLLKDEPHRPGDAALIGQYASVIRAAAPTVKIWEDTTWPLPSADASALARSLDEWSPQVDMWVAARQAFDDFFAAQRTSGRSVWLYSCSGPGRLLDPYSYYRLQAWFAWRVGAVGSNYWTFADAHHAVSWRDYAAGNMGGYSPLFFDGATVMSSKQMEAIREGEEDYEYLHILEQLAKRLETTPGRAGRAAELRHLLDDGVNTVLGDLRPGGTRTWAEMHDRGKADVVRQKLLDALVE
jgi:hypothetical protein